MVQVLKVKGQKQDADWGDARKILQRNSNQNQEKVLEIAVRRVVEEVKGNA
jgi:hypothetical protein